MRRIVFVGAALAQICSAGRALALLLDSLGVGLGFLRGELGPSFLATVGGVVARTLDYSSRLCIPLAS